MYNLISHLKSIGIFRVCCFLLYLINPFNYGHIFANILILSFIVERKKLIAGLDKNVALLFLFSCVYSLFYLFNLDLGVQFIFIYALYPAAFYLVGKSFINVSIDKKSLFFLFFTIGVFFSFTALISVLIDINLKGFVVIERDVPSIWTGNTIPATNMAAYLVLNMCIPALLVSNFKKTSIYFKVFSLLIFMLSIVCVLRLGSRTQISIFFITFLMSIGYLISKQTVKQNLALIGSIFIVFNLFLGYVSLDKDSDIMSAFAGRMESKKYGANTAGGRTERWSKSVVNLWDKPLGWPVEEFGFSHNLWLDVARVGGTLSFILLAIFTIYNLFKLKKSIVLDKTNIAINTIFIVYGCSFYLLFFVEPIFDGYFSLFILYCFFLGIVNEYLSIGNNENLEQKLKSNNSRY